MAKKHMQYGEPKKPRQFVLTEKASAILDEHSEACGLSRSDFLEQMLRAVDECGSDWSKDFLGDGE